MGNSSSKQGLSTGGVDHAKRASEGKMLAAEKGCVSLSVVSHSLGPYGL